MDITETYIKMCEKAEEIQKRKFESGDWVFAQWVKGWDKTVEVFTFAGNHPFNNPVWLPRQDQLQGMIKPRHITRLVEDLDKFTISCESCWRGNVQISMEQLWLAFCMSEKFNKVWTGDKWQSMP